MRVTWDPANDLAYIHLEDAIAPGAVAQTVECESSGTSVYLDFDASGILLGIESVRASKTFPKSLLDNAERY